MNESGNKLAYQKKKKMIFMMCTVLPAVVGDPTTIGISRLCQKLHLGHMVTLMLQFWAVLFHYVSTARAASWLIDFPFSLKCGHQLTKTVQNQAEKQWDPRTPFFQGCSSSRCPILGLGRIWLIVKAPEDALFWMLQLDYTQKPSLTKQNLTWMPIW